MKETIKPSQQGFIDPNTGIWNSMVTIDGKIYRERCEALIIKENQVFLNIRRNGYKLPGGSTERYKTIEEQLAAECREEARINIRDPKYIASYISYWDKPPVYLDENAKKYEGKYTHSYLAYYSSRYNGFIDEHDKDEDMYLNGKFYNIPDVFHLLRKEHKTAIYWEMTKRWLYGTGNKEKFIFYATDENMDGKELPKGKHFSKTIDGATFKAGRRAKGMTLHVYIPSKEVVFYEPSKTDRVFMRGADNLIIEGNPKLHYIGDIKVSDNFNVEWDKSRFSPCPKINMSWDWEWV